jgi:4-amino-4-deoxy-L-arabinose transferase-like glycosyltransferase
MQRLQPWILYGAFVLLGVLLFLFDREHIGWGDSYDLVAKHMIEGRGMSEAPVYKEPWDVPDYSLVRFWEKHGLKFGVMRFNQPTALWDPGYPILLAFWFLIFGYHSSAVLILQILLLGISLVIIYHLGAHLFNPRVGFIAGIILLIHPYLLRFTQDYASENLFIPLFFGGIGAWYLCRKSPSISKVILFSLLWAAAGLTRTVGVYFAAFSIVTLFLSTPGFRKYIFLSAGIFIVLWGGWTYRNWAVMGEARFLPTKIGYNLWRWNNRYYLDELLYQRNGEKENVYFSLPESAPILRQKYGFTDEEIQELAQYDYPPEVADSSEFVINRALTKRFDKFFKDHPKIVMGYFVDRFFLSFADSLGGLRHFKLYRLRTTYFLLLFTLALVGFVLTLTDIRKYWYLLSITVLYSLTLGTMIGFRFRLPLDGILALYAGRVILYFYDRIRRKPSIIEK